MRSHLAGPGNFSTVQANWRPVLENKIMKEKLLAFICDAVVSLSRTQMLSKSHRIPCSWIKNNPPPTPPLKLEFLTEDFRSELLKNNTPPPQNCNFSWKTWGLQFWAYQEYPTKPPRIGTSHGKPGDFGSEMTKNTPSRIGTSHGRLRDFDFEFTNNTPLH